MQHEPIFSFIIICLYAFIAWLVLYQIEIRLRWYAKTKCKLGYHKRIAKELGKTVKKYRCVHCNQPKSHPHLKIVEGGKKDLSTPFKF